MVTIVPTEEIRYSNINVSVKSNSVSIDIQRRKVGGKRWKKKYTINAKMSYELRSWLLDKKVKLSNGNKATGFQKYLEKQGIEFHPGILKDMSFECHNLSEEYAENPFKILLYPDGSSCITLVHIKRKIKNQNGEWVDQARKYYSKFCFRRLVILENILQNETQHANA